MSKEFDVNYIMQNGERRMADEVKAATDKLIHDTTFKQANIIEQEMEKLIEDISPEELKKLSVYLENITYSAGIIKGLSRVR